MVARVDSALAPTTSGMPAGTTSRANPVRRTFSSSSSRAPSPVDPNSTRPSGGCSHQRRRLSLHGIGATSPLTLSNGVVTGANTPRSRSAIDGSGKRPHLELEVRRIVRGRLGDLERDQVLRDQVHQVLVEGL